MEVDTTPVAVSGRRRIETLKGNETFAACCETPRGPRGEGASPTAAVRNLEGGKAKRATARSLA